MSIQANQINIRLYTLHSLPLFIAQFHRAAADLLCNAININSNDCWINGWLSGFVRLSLATINISLLPDYEWMNKGFWTLWQIFKQPHNWIVFAHFYGKKMWARVMVLQMMVFDCVNEYFVIDLWFFVDSMKNLPT